MEKIVITWNAKEVMEKHSIRASDLAESMGVSKNSVSNLRGAEMPRMDGDRLNNLIIHLNKLRRAGSPLITPSDLIGFSLTPDEVMEVRV